MLTSSTPASPINRRRSGVGRLYRSADAAALGLILLCGLLARVVLVYGAPVFIMKDSQSYFLPGWDLAHGLPFDLELRRTPLYSWFVALVLRVFGDQLVPLAIVQHGLGLITVAGTYWLGRAVFGRGVGLAAGLLTALAGPLLLFEHYVMPEALFTCLLVLGVGALVAGLRLGRLRWYFLGGLLLGLAALTRPAAQLALLALPVVALAMRRPLRGVAVSTALAVAGLATVVTPWMLAVYADYGVVSTGATVGEPLIFRTVHQDRGFRLPDPRLTPFSDDARNQARRTVLEMAAKRENPSAMVHRLRRDLKLSQPAADVVLRDVALEIIGDQPLYYAWSTARLTGALFLGRHEALSYSWTTRRDRAGEDTLENWQSVDRVRQLIQPASPTQRAAYGWVDRVVNVFQPSRLSLPIGVLFALGMLGCVLRPRWRAGLLLGLTALALLLTCTLFSGAVPRFRYPADPFIHTVALGGLALCLDAARSLAARLRSRPSARLAKRVPVTADLVGR
ncbi:MAG: glycosyltransferase family 39 protein [Chloroflexi bacterium]|nr:glycosyltransferase family 39 protein [Chloroflexota bacterium]